ncbi:hypothetical protein [Micromonospora sagamiensis]|uniref:Uncharacterized protein n=1 Tax=Micromonospora sagamiensis TaxID=47875 RepID=A0A562WHP3_9ACTN|nr:hypothetical protein [Micromonospora sagamiensis]TWJ29668.1 hypothetical protein JD81_03179 [Micromonospora sagamiensis]BCL17301.1 hypothetical protein GCM10017556_50400 [Micromonospora sagamiensis]
MDEQPPVTAVPRRPGGRTLLFQYATVVVFLVGAVYPLLAAAAGTGDWAGLADPRLERYGDPKDWQPPFLAAWNPLLWILVVSRVLVVLSGVTVLGLVGVVVGVARLVRLAGRTAATERDRFVGLLVGTLLCASVTVVTLTPYGAQLRTWLLD